MIQGILFDMDGILFDTERLSIEVSTEILTGWGYTLPDDYLARTCGSNYASFRAAMLELFPGLDFDAFSDAAHAGIAARLEREGVPKMPGLDMLLDWLRAAGYKMAVASSTRYATIESHLENAGVRDYFTAIVAGDMVQNSKPHPEPFLLAAEKLGLAPQSCVAVEDSPNGIRSAAAAGCVTIMVPDMIPATEELRQIASVVLPALGEIPAYLESLQ